MNIDNAAQEHAAFQMALEAGLAHFNARRFDEAYEVWEARWQEETTEGADLLQGLLQIAVGFAKLQGGNPRATLKMLTGGAEKLAGYPPAAYGLDLSAILSLVERWRGAAAEMVERGSAVGVRLPGQEDPSPG